MKSTTSILQCRSALTPLVLTLSLHSAFAIDGQWISTTGGSWAEAGNWQSETIASDTGAIADFSTLALSAPATVHLDGDRTIGSLLFGDTASSANAWTLAAGSGGALTLATSSGVPSLSVAGTSLVSTAVISGTQGFEKTGNGTLTLSAANTFSGPLLISAGIVKVGNIAALGTTGAANETVAAAGGALDLNGVVLYANEIVRIAGDGPSGAGALVNTGAAQNNGLTTLVLTGDASIGGTARFDVRNEAAPRVDLAGHTLTKIGANQVSIVGPAQTAESPPMTVAPGNIVINEGILAIETRSTADANGSIAVNSGGVFGLWGNVKDLFYRPVISNGGIIRNLGSGAKINSPVTVQEGTQLHLDGSSTTTLIGAISGNASILKTGSGTFELNQSPSFSGKALVTSGLLASRWASFLGAAPASFQADALTLNGGGVGSLFDGSFFADGGPDFPATRGITLGEAGGTFDVYGHQRAEDLDPRRARMIVNSVISGPGELRKVGGGYLNLTAPNTYEGGTIVSNGPLVNDARTFGALQLAFRGKLGSGPLTFTNTGSINGIRFLASNHLPNDIALSSAANATNPVTTRFIADSGSTVELSGAISGGSSSGARLQLDGGTFIFSAEENPYWSDTLVRTGTLLVESDWMNSIVTVGTLPVPDGEGAGVPGTAGAIGGSGMVYELIVNDGSTILASEDPVKSEFGVTIQGDGEEDPVISVRPATNSAPGNHILSVVDYGAGNIAPPVAAFTASGYRAAAISDDSVNHRINLSYTTATRTWAGTDDPYWDVAYAGNWVEGDHFFYQGDAVVFDDTADATDVLLFEGVAPYSTTVTGTKDYSISGSGEASILTGSLTKSGSGTLTINASNGFTGPIAIQGGVIKAGNGGALGYAGSITIGEGAALDINGQQLYTGSRSYSITIAGAGPDGKGAITNSGGAVYSYAAIQNVTLSGDATIGGDNGRFDVGFIEGGVSGVIEGNGHTFTKVGTAPIGFRGDASGTPIHFVIEAGTSWAENTDNAWGGETGTLTVKSGARAGTYGNLTIPTPVTLENGATLHNQGGGTGTWTGPISAAGDVTLEAGNPVFLLGGVAGAAGITKTGGNTLTVAEPLWSGNTTVAAGTLSLRAANPANDAGGYTLAGGAVLNLDFSETDRVAFLIVNGDSLDPGVYGEGSPGVGSAITGDGTITVGEPSSGNYASWAAGNGIPGQPGNIDSDDDGIFNLMEYALGLNPTQPDGFPGVFENGTITFNKGVDAVMNRDVIYTIEVSSTLGAEPSPWTPVEPTEETTTIISYTLPAGHPKIFARLVVTQP